MWVVGATTANSSKRTPAAEKNHNRPRSHRYLPRRDLLSLQGSHIEVLRSRCRKESCEVNMLMCIRRQEVKVQEVTMQLLERVKVRELMLPDDELQYVEVKAIEVEEMMTRI